MVDLSQDYLGRSFIFRYPHFGSPDLFPEHSAHRDQIVTVIGEVTSRDDDERRFNVRAADGWIGEACESELAKCHAEGRTDG
jgi:hypothetical protein